jgi:hypothetical protein
LIVPPPGKAFLIFPANDEIKELKRWRLAFLPEHRGFYAFRKDESNEDHPVLFRVRSPVYSQALLQIPPDDLLSCISKAAVHRTA